MEARPVALSFVLVDQLLSLNLADVTVILGRMNFCAILEGEEEERWTRVRRHACQHYFQIVEHFAILRVVHVRRGERVFLVHLLLE